MSTLDLSQIETKDELMDSLKDFFLFPDWWGRNWDSFADCISDRELSTLPSPIEIIWMGDLEKNLGEDALMFQEILDENDIEYTLLPS